MGKAERREDACLNVECGHSVCVQHYIDTGSKACLVRGSISGLDEHLRMEGLVLAHHLEHYGKIAGLEFTAELAEKIREAARLVEMEAIARDMSTELAFCTHCGCPRVQLEAWVLCNDGQVIDYTGSDAGYCGACTEWHHEPRVDFETVKRSELDARIEERNRMSDEFIREHHDPEYGR